MLADNELESVRPGVGKAWPFGLHSKPIPIPGP